MEAAWVAGIKARWPPPNVQLGVSVEDQATANERIPLLLQCPASVRFVSYEPALGPVSFRWAAWDDWGPNPRRSESLPPVERAGKTLAGSVNHLDGLRMLDWIIVGGESGPGARPFDLAWARWTIAQCREADVPCFVKQLGRVPVDSAVPGDHPDLRALQLLYADPKGGDPLEWPEDLRVREFPATPTQEAAQRA